MSVIIIVDGETVLLPIRDSNLKLLWHPFIKEWITNASACACTTAVKKTATHTWLSKREWQLIKTILNLGVIRDGLKECTDFSLPLPPKKYDFIFPL